MGKAAAVEVAAAPERKEQKMAKAKDDTATDVQNDTAAAVADAAPDLEGLIEVEKDGERLHVHPTCLLPHERLGWKRVL